jgi:cytochrome c biogenesis protein CcmG, thiol:disulfide interchange protein DsbE
LLAVRLTFPNIGITGKQRNMIFSRALRIASALLFVSFAAAGVASGESARLLDPVETLELESYRGKVVVVDFWASWCVPCRRSFPWLDEMQHKYGDEGLVVIGVNEDDAAGDAEDFLRDYPVSFRIVRDREGALARQFDLLAMPSSYVLDRNGEIAARHLGFKSARQEEYEETLRRLLRPAVAGGNGARLSE